MRHDHPKLTSRLVVLAVCLGAFALTGCPSPPPLPPPTLDADPADDDPMSGGEAVGALDRAMAYVEREAWEQALPHLEKALRANPEHAKATYYHALAKQRLGHSAEAEEGFKKAIALDDKLTLARAHLGELYLTGDPLRSAEAVEVLGPAADAEPSDPDIQQLLAFALRVEKDYDRAATHYERALAAEDSDKVRFDFADMLFEAGMMDKAAEQMRKLFPKLKTDLKQVAQFALRFRKAKAWKDCVDAYTTAIELKKDEKSFYLNRGLCRHSLKETEDTVRNDYQKALELDPRFQTGWYYLGMSWLHSKKRRRARDAFRTAVKLGKDSEVGKKAQAKLDGMK